MADAGAGTEGPAAEVMRPDAVAAPRLAAALALMLASGFAALGYQVVWTQQSAIWLGHETAAVLAVVAAFFGGLALGALALGPRIEASRHPARWYAACEGAIGLWSVALAFLLAPVSRGLLELTGEQPSAAWQWTVAFGGTFLLLLPATAAMGATLPAMERVLARLRREGVGIAALYAGNTFGAVVGVLAAAFWLVPAFGLARTALVCAALNLACAAATLAMFRGAGAMASPPSPALPPGSVPLSASASAPPSNIGWQLAATGLLGIGYEVLVVRVLSQVAENTVYTFAILLAVYLVGTAAGAALYARWLAGRTQEPVDLRDWLLWLLALACLIGTASLWGAPTVKALVQPWAGGGMAAALWAEAALALIAFLPATLVMGALFSHLAARALQAGFGFGRALGVNTFGAALAPGLFGVLLVPLLGPKLALLLVAAGYLALLSRPGWRAPRVAAAAGAGLALAVWAPPLAFVDIPEGGRLVSYREGAMGAVSVVEDANGVMRLHINNRQQEGSSATRLADARQALLPLLLHPAPQHALFLGLGTGVTAASAAADPTLQIEAVELLPEVIDASRHFVPGEGADHPRLHVLAADARRFVRATPRRYDLIVSDNFHPARSGSGALYTVEHFQAVRERLTAQGLFCQWLPLHQLDLETLRSIVRAFVAVYPGGSALLATNSLETPVLGLVARADAGRFDLGRLRARMAQAAQPLQLAAFGLVDDLALFGSFIAGPRSLMRFAGDAPTNTDDHPVVVYRAPRITYSPDSLPRERLLAMLRELNARPEELLEPVADTAWLQRLSAYMAARNRFLEAGRSVLPQTDVRRMLAQVREPLLAVLRTSPDFRPAYDPLLRMAGALARVDPAAARALLRELLQVQPLRPEAAEALRSLGEPIP